MPVIQTRNAEAQLLGSPDHLFTDDRNFPAVWTDAAGGTSFLGSTVVPFDTEILNPAPEVYSMASGIVTIAEAGFYMFTFSATATHAGSAELIWAMTLDEDPDVGSYTVVPGTLTYSTFFTGSNTMHNSAIVLAGADYLYRLAVARIGGADTPSLVAGASKLTVFRLFKNG